MKFFNCLVFIIAITFISCDTENNDKVCPKNSVLLDEKCECVHGYVSYEDECIIKQTNPCLNEKCSNHGTCEDNNGKIKCTCEAGFEGDKCQNDIDECAINLDDCSEQAKCLNTEGSYECICNQGYSGNGKNCVFICDSNKLLIVNEQNNGCVCKNGYHFDADDVCIEDEQCNNSSCGAGVCSIIDSEISCDCSGTGFTGDKCQNNIDDCINNECEHGTCVDGLDSYTCDCSGTGFTGDKCQNNIDDCINNECENGTCIDGLDSYTCDCSGTGFTGDKCQNNIDDCINNECEHGTCVDGLDSYTCDCSGTGFTGDKCQTGPCLEEEFLHNNNCISLSSCDNLESIRKIEINELVEDYWGLSMEGNNFQAENCDIDKSLGNDIIYEISLEKGKTIRAEASAYLAGMGDDLSIYLLNSCDESSYTCLVGSDQYGDINGSDGQAVKEIFDYEVEQTGTYFIVIDSKTGSLQGFKFKVEYID